MFKPGDIVIFVGDYVGSILDGDGAWVVLEVQCIETRQQRNVTPYNVYNIVNTQTGEVYNALQSQIELLAEG